MNSEMLYIGVHPSCHLFISVKTLAESWSQNKFESEKYCDDFSSFIACC